MVNFCLDIQFFFKFPEKSKFLVKLPDVIEFFGNLPGKNRNFLVKLPEKIKKFSEICLEKSISF